MLYQLSYAPILVIVACFESKKNGACQGKLRYGLCGWFGVVSVDGVGAGCDDDEVA